GGQAVFTLIVRVDPGASAGSTVALSSSVSTTTADPNPGNQAASASTTVRASAVAAAALAITQTAPPSPATVGQPLTYTLTVPNPGPPASSGVSVTDPLPAGAVFVSASPGGSVNAAGNVVIFAVGSLDVGASVTMSVAVVPTGAGTLTI